MPQTFDPELLLYADDTCLIFMGKDTKLQLNKEIQSLCDWFIDNKLNIYFGEEKAKCILFGTKQHFKNQSDFDIRHGDIKTKQHSKVTYLGCILATKVFSLVNGD